jgi:2-polyprenyl-6-hydroxyphenyl methylase/3-demethylubiquinone-9 3-methyltransferase
MENPVMMWRDRKSPPLTPATTADPAEIARFTASAATWWDPNGPFRTLHRLNPVRLAFIRDQLCRLLDRSPDAERPFVGLRVLDIGCGGGLLSEPFARWGAEVVGIDATAKLVEVARAHAASVGAPVSYRHALAEELAEAGERFDVILNTEVVEHVAQVERFLECCCRMLEPGGAMIVATLNRTVRSLLFAKIAGEYVLGLLPRGTHDWRRFIKPDELANLLARYGVSVEKQVGVGFNPFLARFRLTADLSVNYMAVARRPMEARAGLTPSRLAQLPSLEALP